MTKTDIVQEVIGNTIKPYGFAYLGIKDGAWIYRKELGDLRQDINIRLMTKDQLNLYFSTNAPLQRPCCADELIMEGERRGSKPFGYFRFGCEQEFIEIIEYFKKIIFDYGFDALDKRSVPATEIRPTKETNQFLFENQDKLYGYITKNRYGQKTRHPHDRIVEVLQRFFEAHTDASLEKFTLNYSPLRPDECTFGEEHFDTDEEIRKTLVSIAKMTILKKTHNPGNSYHKYVYEIPIDHYGEALDLVKSKGGKYAVHMTISLDQYFNFNRYCYADIVDFLKSYEFVGQIVQFLSEQDQVNNISLRIVNDIYNAHKCTHSMLFTLLFPALLEPDKIFLHGLEKELKVRFSSVNFFYYYKYYNTTVNREKVRYQWEKVELH